MRATTLRSAGNGSGIVLGLALFFYLYTWGIKLDLALGTTPLWFYVSIPLFFVCMGRIGTLMNFFVAAVVSFVALLFHLYVASELTGMSAAGAGVDARHIAVAIFVSVAIACIAKSASSIQSLERGLLLSVKIFLPIQLVMMVGQTALGYSTGSAEYQHYFLPIERQGGLLREPSHLGIMLSIPISLFLQFPRRWFAEMSFIQSFSLLCIILLCPSASLFVSVLLNFAILMARSNRGRLILFVALFLAPSALSIAYVLKDQNPIFQRIVDLLDILSGSIDEHKNVSSIVYAKSVYVLQKVMENYPFGFGLDNYIFANWMYGFQLTKAFGNLNERDGSSAALKFLTEFGGPGFILLVLVLVKHARDAFGSSPRKMLGVIFLNLLIGNVIRGAGYFDAGFLLPFAGMFVGNNTLSRPIARRAEKAIGVENPLESRDSRQSMVS